MECDEVVRTWRHLHGERLLVRSELESLARLNEHAEAAAQRLARAAWAPARARAMLRDHREPSCRSNGNNLSIPPPLSPVFVDAHTVLRYQDALVISETIQRLRASPALATLWLCMSESVRPPMITAAARTLCSGIYVAAGCSSCDITKIRNVLLYLARYRLATMEDPRKMICQGDSSFSRVYCELVDSFRPARLFLIAALRGPLLPLLQLDEYLLVDPDEALDRVKKYPSSSNSDYQQKVARYRRWTIRSLVLATKRFIVSFAEHWTCFPPTIAWVVRQTALTLRATGRVSEEDIHFICTELVFTNFICQAIANPEAFGVTDIPISNIGRFNLMQVAQTLRVLCLMKYQDVDNKIRDLYSELDKDGINILLNSIMVDESFSMVREDAVVEEVSTGKSLKTEPTINANVALFTRNDLQLLISLLKRILSCVSNGFDSSPEQINHSSSSNSILDQDVPEQSFEKPVTENNIKKPNGAVRSSSFHVPLETDDSSDTACGVTSASSNGDLPLTSNLPMDEGVMQLFRSVNPELLAKMQSLIKKLPSSSVLSEQSTKKPSSKGKLDANTLAKNSNSNKINRLSIQQQSYEVLIIKLPGDSAYEPIGMVPENKVMEYHYSSLVIGCQNMQPYNENGAINQANVKDGPGTEEQLALDSNVAILPPANQHPGQEKRTRFSLSHDEGSIGNTSDNLEVVSEAASNRSVTSSLEMETEDQNDNLSDMVSANVSGRGSPNISGRDTPSSQVTEGEPVVPPAPQVNRNPPNGPLAAAAASKQAKQLKKKKNDIDNKFCKFEIKKLLEGDETISIISDTWSTDVLASDSETIGESTYERNMLTSHINVQPNLAVVVEQQALPLVAPLVQPDVSETASESAWSTDALVSDSDRMTEVDMDDCNSVAHSESEMSRPDVDTPQQLVLQPHHQFSPHNNITRDALITRRQMSAAASPHSAHPDNVPACLINSQGEINLQEQDEAAAPLFTGDDEVTLRRTGNVSPLFNPRPYNEKRRGVAYHRVGDPTLGTGASRESAISFMNGFSDSGLSQNTERNCILESPLSALDSPAQGMNFPIFNDNPTENRSDLFDFNSRPESLNEAMNFNAPGVNVVTPPDDIFHSVNSPFVQTMVNGSATSRWLNDPSQQFSIIASSDLMDEEPSTSRNIPICNTESVFRPIKVERDNEQLEESDIRPSSIGDASSYMNGSVKNGISENRFDSNNIENNLVSRMHSMSIVTTQHSFASPNLVTNTTSRISKTSETKTSIININSSKVEKIKSDVNVLEKPSPEKGISLSTLSVNSVDTTTSDRSSSQDVNSENLTERRISPSALDQISGDDKAKATCSTLPRNSASSMSSMKPGASTGAIPKSISFDSTAEKNHRHNIRRMTEDNGEGSGINFGDLKNNVKKSGGNILNKIKQFRNKSRGFASSAANFAGKKGNSQQGNNADYPGDDNSKAGNEGDENGSPEDLAGNSCESQKSQNEISDDILAKYRRKVSSSSEAATSDSTSSSGGANPRNGNSSAAPNMNSDDNANVSDGESAPDRHSDISKDIEFESVKRKLRLVLSNMDMSSIEISAGRPSSVSLACTLRLEGGAGPLNTLLALEACGRAPLASLHNDARLRRNYFDYLTACRRSLLIAVAALENEIEWHRNETLRQVALAAAARARSSLAMRESRLVELQERLRSGLSDEKRDILLATLSALVADMASEDTWAGASDWELEQAALTVERTVMGRVYTQAMFPNGDGDILRDQLLHDHISKLNSSGAGIPDRRLSGAPWVPAQRMLAHLHVYKTPRDKVDCIVRCVNSIIALLSMSTDGGAPGADHLTPVLVFVLIKANPSSLLSTVQYVNTFMNVPLEGEQLYCWTQFCSAIEYIKTM